MFAHTRPCGLGPNYTTQDVWGAYLICHIYDEYGDPKFISLHLKMIALALACCVSFLLSAKSIYRRI